MLADVVGGERAQRRDRAAPATQVGKHASHQTIGHALAAKARVGFDVRHDDHTAPEAIVSDRHDVVVDDQLVALALSIISDGVLHVGSVPPKHAPGVSMCP